MTVNSAKSLAAATISAAALFSLPACKGTPPVRTPTADSPSTGAPAEPLDARLADAQRALAQKQYPQALRKVDEALAKGAPASDACRLKAEVFRAAEYRDLEMDALRAWTKADPRNPEPLVQLFYAYLDLGWRTRAGQASAIALKLSPADYRANIARAIYFYRSAEPERGLPFAEAARRARPRDPDVANLRATILLKRLRYAEAEKAAREALALAPANLENRLALGGALARQQKLDQAAAEYSEVLRIDPGSLEALFESGALAEKRGDRKSALAFFEKLAAQDVQYGTVAYRLGNLYLKGGRAEEGRRLLAMYRKMESATSAYETLLTRMNAAPDNPELHYRLARQHLDSGELPQTIVELKEVLRLSPRHMLAQRDLIHALMRHGRTTEARQIIAAREAAR